MCLEMGQNKRTLVSWSQSNKPVLYFRCAHSFSDSSLPKDFVQSFQARAEVDAPSTGNPKRAAA